MEATAQVSAAVYDAGEKWGILLGDGSTKITDKNKVKLNLDLETWEGRPPGKLLVHCQDGTTQALPLIREGETILCELELKKWETAAIEMIPREKMPTATMPR
jgi:hypothetical protein